MGVVFEARNKKTQKVSRFFFSTKDFLDRVENTSGTSGQDVNLTLGTTQADWFDAVSDLSEHLYPIVVDEIRADYETFAPGAVTTRHIEVLLGNPIQKLCMRVARAHAQIGLLRHLHDWDLLSVSNKASSPGQLPTTSKDTYALIESDSWGEFVEVLVLKQLFGLKQEWELELRERREQNPQAENRNLSKKIYLLAQKVLAPLATRNSISISASYLGRVKEVLLSLLLLQVPMLTEVRAPQSPNSFLRQRLLTTSTNNDLAQIVAHLMRGLIPTMLLEDLSTTVANARKLGFSQKAKVFFTSNSFDSDDLYKANLFRALGNASYVMGQHGGGYGTTTLLFETPEMNASDLFLSWGWVHPSQNVLPLGQLKPKIRMRGTQTGSLVINLRPDIWGDTFADVAAVGNFYFDQVISLCKELDARILNVAVRPHGSTSTPRLQQLEEAFRAMKHVGIAGEFVSFQELVKRGSRIVFTYDSTGMLEMASARLPFFSFIPTDLGLIRPEFQDNYDALRKAGLLSEDPKEAARLIDGWTKSDVSQTASQIRAVIGFSEGLVHYPKNKLLTIRKLLRGARTQQRIAEGSR